MYDVRALSVGILTSPLGKGKKAVSIDRAKVGRDSRRLFML
jgi:hypothetical protein